MTLRFVTACAFAAVIATSACIVPLKREKFEKVQLGMTEDEVQKICGKPNAVSDMNATAGPQGIPFGGYEPGTHRPVQFMWVYTSGMEFAQIYFEDKRVFGVRFNNEFLKGDWMEGERMPEQVLPPANAQPSTVQPSEPPDVESAPSDDQPYEAPSEGSDDE